MRVREGKKEPIEKQREREREVQIEVLGWRVGLHVSEWLPGRAH